MRGPSTAATRAGRGIIGAPLLERERELARFDELLGRVGEGGPRFVLVEGPAGIGKSRLLDEMAERAARGGVGVLAARAAHLEQEFAFGVARQLFEPVLADPGRRERLLAGAAASAARVFDVAGAFEAGAVDGSFAALHGLYWLAANVAEDAPLLLVVDDLHWCDRPSLRFIAYLARRLAGSEILLAASLRAGEPGTDPVLVAELAASPEAVRIVPRPLSEPAVADVVAERLGARPEPAFAAACLEATGGNPLLLGQLLTSLGEEGVRPVAAEVAAVREIGPRAISRTVLVRLHRLGVEAVAVAQALAVLGDGADERAVALLAEIGQAEAAAAVSALERAEILRAQALTTFVHPLVRDAIYHELPLGERVLRHARAAVVLAAFHAPPEQVATHLLAAPPRGERWVVETLAAAAASARAKGAADTAVSLLARALAEPPEPAQRPDLLLELGLAETLTSGPSAVAHLREAWETLEDPRRRAQAATILARTLFLTAPGREAAAVARRAAAETPPELVDERQALLATELAAARYTGGTPTAEELELVRVEGDGAGAKMLLAILSFDLAMAGADADRCAALAEDALAGGVLIAADPGFFPVAALIVLTMADREQALAEWEKLRALVHRRGSLFGMVSVNLWSGLTLLWRGDLRDAQERLEAAHEQFADWGRTRSRVTYGAAFLGDARRLRGDLAGARATLDGGLDEDDGSDGFAQLLRSRTALLLEEGKFAQGLEHSRRLEELDAAIASFPGWVPWRSLRARALAGLGRLEEALPLAREEVEVASRFGAAGVVGRSLRVLGTLDPDEGLARLRQAVEVLERSTARLELAAALAALGTALRLARQPTEAREPLRRALELADRCGAEGLVQRARTELYAAGARPRTTERSGVGSLTASERRVAELAAEGRTNKEIAQSLYVTLKTVEVHLSSSYRKLGIGSRHALADALADPSPG